MATTNSLIINSVDQASKKNQKTLTDINPDANTAALKTFATKLNALTTNSLDAIAKVTREEFDPTITYYDPIWVFGNDLGVLTVDGNTITAPIAQLQTTVADAATVDLNAQIGTTPSHYNIPATQIFKTIKVEFVPGADAQYSDNKECCFGVVFAYNESASYFNVYKPYDLYDQPCTVKITLPAGSFIVNNTTYYYNESVITVNFV